MKKCDLNPASDLSCSKGGHSVARPSAVNPHQEYRGGRTDSDFSIPVELVSL